MESSPLSAMYPSKFFYRIVPKIDVLWYTLFTLACRKTNTYRGLTATTTREAKVLLRRLEKR